MYAGRAHGFRPRLRGGFVPAMFGWLLDIVKDVGSFVVMVGRLLGWQEVKKQTIAPTVAPSSTKPRPFIVMEATKDVDDPFAELVGMEFQQEMLKVVVAMQWKYWRTVEMSMRSEKRRRIAFLLFTGAIGTGKTSHATAFACLLNIPCVCINPGSATFVDSQGMSTMHHVLEYCVERKSCLIYWMK